MKPYNTYLNKAFLKIVYNYRLFRVRRIIENTFLLLSSVFRVFCKPIEIKVEETIVSIVLACFTFTIFLECNPILDNFNQGVLLILIQVKGKLFLDNGEKSILTTQV